MEVKDLLEEIQKTRKISEKESDLIHRAFNFAQKAHSGQKRESGEPYFNHSYQTALELSRWKLDSVTIAAGLLHDVMEDCGVSPEEIKKIMQEVEDDNRKR